MFAKNAASRVYRVNNTRLPPIRSQRTFLSSHSSRLLSKRLSNTTWTICSSLSIRKSDAISSKQLSQTQRHFSAGVSVAKLLGKDELDHQSSDEDDHHNIEQEPVNPDYTFHANLGTDITFVPEKLKRWIETHCSVNIRQKVVHVQPDPKEKKNDNVNPPKQQDDSSKNDDEEKHQVGTVIWGLSETSVDSAKTTLKKMMCDPDNSAVMLCPNFVIHSPSDPTAMLTHGIGLGTVNVEHCGSIIPDSILEELESLTNSCIDEWFVPMPKGLARSHQTGALSDGYLPALKVYSMLGASINAASDVAPPLRKAAVQEACDRIRNHVHNLNLTPHCRQTQLTLLHRTLQAVTNPDNNESDAHLLKTGVSKQMSNVYINRIGGMDGGSHCFRIIQDFMMDLECRSGASLWFDSDAFRKNQASSQNPHFLNGYFPIIPPDERGDGWSVSERCNQIVSDAVSECLSRNFTWIPLPSHLINAFLTIGSPKGSERDKVISRIMHKYRNIHEQSDSLDGLDVYGAVVNAPMNFGSLKEFVASGLPFEDYIGVLLIHSDIRKNNCHLRPTIEDLFLGSDGESSGLQVKSKRPKRQSGIAGVDWIGDSCALVRFDSPPLWSLVYGFQGRFLDHLKKSTGVACIEPIHYTGLSDNNTTGLTSNENGIEHLTRNFVIPSEVQDYDACLVYDFQNSDAVSKAVSQIVSVFRHSFIFEMNENPNLDLSKLQCQKDALDVFIRMLTALQRNNDGILAESKNKKLFEFAQLDGDRIIVSAKNDQTRRQIRKWLNDCLHRCKMVECGEGFSGILSQLISMKHPLVSTLLKSEDTVLRWNSARKNGDAAGLAYLITSPSEEGEKSVDEFVACLKQIESDHVIHVPLHLDKNEMNLLHHFITHLINVEVLESKQDWLYHISDDGISFCITEEPESDKFKRIHRSLNELFIDNPVVCSAVDRRDLWCDHNFHSLLRIMLDRDAALSSPLWMTSTDESKIYTFGFDQNTVDRICSIIDNRSEISFGPKLSTLIHSVKSAMDISSKSTENDNLVFDFLFKNNGSLNENVVFYRTHPMSNSVWILNKDEDPTNREESTRMIKERITSLLKSLVFAHSWPFTSGMKRIFERDFLSESFRTELNTFVCEESSMILVCPKTLGLLADDGGQYSHYRSELTDSLKRFMSRTSVYSFNHNSSGDQISKAQRGLLIGFQGRHLRVIEKVFNFNLIVDEQSEMFYVIGKSEDSEERTNQLNRVIKSIQSNTVSLQPKSQENLPYLMHVIRDVQSKHNAELFYDSEQNVLSLYANEANRSLVLRHFQHSGLHFQ